MKQEELDFYMSELSEPALKIEKALKMGEGTLQKAIKGTRPLPVKWIEPLKEYFKKQTGKIFFYVSKKDNPQNNNHVPNEVKPEIIEDEEWNKVRDKINKDFGEGSVINMGQIVKKQGNIISSGSIALNTALGIGGLPRGRMIEIFGQESSGKTTLAIHIIVEAQRDGSKCAIVDSEQAFDADYAEKLGVDLTRLEISQPDYGEQSLEIAGRMIESKKFSVVIVDSVAALVPKKELEGEAGDSAMGKQAWLMNQACRTMVGPVAKTNTLLIWINQLRSRLGTMPFQNPWVTCGGNALKFFCSIRLEIIALTKIKDGEVIVGNRAKVRVVKNKMAPPFKNAEFDFLYGVGIDKLSELIDIASDLGIIKKSGTWFSYNDAKLGQGKESVKLLLKDNPEMLLEIENKIKPL